MKAFIKASWRTSSASCRFFTMRYARHRILLEWRLLSSKKAKASPDLAAETSRASLISFRLPLMTELLAGAIRTLIRPTLSLKEFLERPRNYDFSANRDP